MGHRFQGEAVQGFFTLPLSTFLYQITVGPGSVSRSPCSCQNLLIMNIVGWSNITQSAEVFMWSTDAMWCYPCRPQKAWVNFVAGNDDLCPSWWRTEFVWHHFEQLNPRQMSLTCIFSRGTKSCLSQLSSVYLWKDRSANGPAHVYLPPCHLFARGLRDARMEASLRKGPLFALAEAEMSAQVKQQLGLEFHFPWVTFRASKFILETFNLFRPMTDLRPVHLKYCCILSEYLCPNQHSSFVS